MTDGEFICLPQIGYIFVLNIVAPVLFFKTETSNGHLIGQMEITVYNAAS